jgi:hypothetical protein
MNLIDEWLSDALYAYGLRVRAKRDGQYTLTEIWEPLAKWLKQTEKALALPGAPIQGLLGALVDLPEMRNRLAAHDDEFAKEFPLGVVRRCAKDAIALVRAVYCEKCGEFARAMREHGEAEVLRCHCEAIRHVRAARGPSDD